MAINFVFKEPLQKRVELQFQRKRSYFLAKFGLGHLAWPGNCEKPLNLALDAAEATLMEMLWQRPDTDIALPRGTRG